MLKMCTEKYVLAVKCSIRNFCMFVHGDYLVLGMLNMEDFIVLGYIFVMILNFKVHGWYSFLYHE
jgi:hypothetical protein